MKKKIEELSYRHHLLISKSTHRRRQKILKKEEYNNKVALGIKKQGRNSEIGSHQEIRQKGTAAIRHLCDVTSGL